MSDHISPRSGAGLLLPNDPAVPLSEISNAQADSKSQQAWTTWANTQARPGQGSNVTPSSDWSAQEEVRIRFSGFPPDLTTRDVWEMFHRQGSLVFIDIWRDTRGRTNGTGTMCFRPPPNKAFWHHRHTAALKGRSQTFSIALELKAAASEPGGREAQPSFQRIAVFASSMQVGVLKEPTTMVPMFSTQSHAAGRISLGHDLRRRQLDIKFPVQLRGLQQGSTVRGKPFEYKPDHHHHLFSALIRCSRDESYMVVFPHTRPLLVYEAREAQDQPQNDVRSLIFILEEVPLLYREQKQAFSHVAGSISWNSNDAWWRATDIVYQPELARSVPLRLHNPKSLLDIGRWKTYKIDFSLNAVGDGSYRRFCAGLESFNVKIRRDHTFHLSSDTLPSTWWLLDNHVLGARALDDRNLQVHGLDELMATYHEELPFSVRYQLEVCISNDVLSEYAMSTEFIKCLHALGPVRARRLLEHVASTKQRRFDSMSIFNEERLQSFRTSRIPAWCVYIRSAIITPSTMHFETPVLEISNRVIRRYREHADRFLRVRFQEERPRGKIFPTVKNTMNEIFTRVKRVLMNGICIGNRRYEFLAFGNSQFRENGAYFFCPLPHLSTSQIRRWMGDFSHIRSVARHAARLGQCFSTTRAVSGSGVTIHEIEDITTNSGEFTFSDGVGIVSPFLARIAATEMGVITTGNDPPSVMQFRLGGAKGVLAVWNHAKHRQVLLRPSQRKFPASSEGLEIIRWSQFASAHLNRQFIIVLSALGIADSVFFGMLREQLQALEAAMHDQRVAVSFLRRDVDPNQMSLVLADIVHDGFMKSCDPFVLSVLRLWRARSLKYLKEKAKISIQKGAILLGCLDELGCLRGYSNPQSGSQRSHEPIANLPEVYIQLSRSRDRAAEVIRGPIVVARHPSLYPGDIRVCLAVDKPELAHLKDVVVFPRTGDRDVPSMCSGGDLDGDDFVVIWDPQLVPPIWDEPPPVFAANPTQTVATGREVTVNDLTSFFVQYMKNQSVATIAIAHMALADESPLGVRDPRCLELADLHSKAVDYAKTGEPAVMPTRLVPRRWPHFQERKGGLQYHSRTIIGRLYDAVDLVKFEPDLDEPFDRRILQAYQLCPAVLSIASNIKERYDRSIARIMSQHGIETDFEVWSTFVMRHSGIASDFNFHEQIGKLSAALKEQYRAECHEAAGGTDFNRIAPFVAAMYAVTAEEHYAALPSRKESSRTAQPWTGASGPQRMPFISFPWLFPTILGRIGLKADLLSPRD